MTTQPMMGAGSDISRVLRLHVGWRIMGSDLGLAQEIITVPTSPVQWGLRHSGRGLFQSGNEELMPRRGSSNYRQQSAPFFFFFFWVLLISQRQRADSRNSLLLWGSFRRKSPLHHCCLILAVCVCHRVCLRLLEMVAKIYSDLCVLMLTRL